MTIDGVKSLSDPQSVANLKNYVENLLKQNLFTQQEPAAGNPLLAYKNHVIRVSKALATFGGAEFLTIQAGLKALNSGPIGTGKILSPTAPYGPPPGAEGLVTDSADIPPFSETTSLPSIAVKKDILKQAGLRTLSEYSQAQLNLYSDKEVATESGYIDKEQPQTIGQSGMRTVEPVPGVQYSVPDYSSIFEERSVGFDFGTGEKGTKSFRPKKEKRAAHSEEHRRRKAALENDDVFFSADELETGYITQDQYELDGISDATNYLPFFLEDMRSGGKRVYFRAFFKGLRESIAPNWSQESYFGRVDPVGIYLNTSRTVSVNFALVSLSPAGFTAMWRKMNALAKMLYPTYRDGVIVKSPTCKLRIGDVICDEAGSGLTGYISSPLELDYTDSPWEITEHLGFSPTIELGKAPMMINVSFTFQVIHQQNPGIDENYNFDTTYFRRIGGLRELPSFSSGDESMSFSQDQADAALAEDET